MVVRFDWCRSASLFSPRLSQHGAERQHGFIYADGDHTRLVGDVPLLPRLHEDSVAAKGYITCQSTRTQNSRRRLRRKSLWAGHLHVRRQFGKASKTMNSGESKATPVLQKLKWFEFIWVGLPLLLMVTGGAIGGVCGFAAFVTNRKVFINTAHLPMLRYVYTAFISIAAVIATFIGAAIFLLVLKFFGVNV